MTAPVDPVKALARTFGNLHLGAICDCHQAGTKPHEGRCNVFILARAALAHARELVPEPQQYRRVADPIHVDGWNACRAETLRRLGGEGI